MSSEKHTYRDSFEELLQEAAGRFRLYPTPRVWQSLYNNIHPAKRNPSTGSWLLIFYCFLLLSVSFRTEKHVKDEKLSIRLPGKESQRGRNYSVSHPMDQITSGINNKIRIVANKLIIKEPPVVLSVPENPNKIISNIRFPENKEKNIISAKQESESVGTTAPLALSRIYDQERFESDHDFEKVHNKLSETNSRFEYQVYATTSMEFRELYKEGNPNESGVSSAGRKPEGSGNSGIAAFNMEAGGNIIFRYNPDVRLKAGVQVNYSNRQILSQQGTGGISSTQSMLDNMSMPTVISGQESITESFQFSIPLGADWMIAGNSAVQWFAGATVQPSFLLPGNSHVILYEPEAPGKQDPTLFRNFNINGGIETFVSFKTTGGITMNAGPQFRYQMLSSYKNMYPYNERLFNIGIKLGITSPF